MVASSTPRLPTQLHGHDGPLAWASRVRRAKHSNLDGVRYRRALLTSPSVSESYHEDSHEINPNLRSSPPGRTHAWLTSSKSGQAGMLILWPCGRRFGFLSTSIVSDTHELKDGGEKAGWYNGLGHDLTVILKSP